MSFTPEDKAWLEERFKDFATKYDLELQSVRLQYHLERKMDEKIDDLAQLTAKSFTDLYEYLDENFQRIDEREKKYVF